MTDRVLTGIGVALTLLVIYAFLGIYSTFNSTILYDDVSRDGFNIDSSHTFRVEIKNGASFSFPYFVPQYQAYVQILNSTNNATCEMRVSSGYYKCENITLDVGKIQPGESESVRFVVSPNHGNFTIRFNAHLLGRVAKQKTIECIVTRISAYGSSANYICTNRD